MKFNYGQNAKRNLLKLTDGQSITGVFRGDPFEFRTHWKDNMSFKCEGNHCDICATGEKSAFKFRINFVHHNGTGFEPIIVEQGWQFYKQLQAINEATPLESHSVKITRNGTGATGTNYTLTDVKPVGTALSKIEAVELLDLGFNNKTIEKPKSAMNHMDQLAALNAAQDDMPF